MELKIRDGRDLGHTSDLLSADNYTTFIKMYDWCTDNVGRFDGDFSTIWSKGQIRWSFLRREDLTRFLLTWY
jgi:hypothetical protein